MTRRDGPGHGPGQQVNSCHQMGSILSLSLNLSLSHSFSLLSLSLPHSLFISPPPPPPRYYETIAGGAGAGPGWHGRSGVHTHMTNTRITDVEILERRQYSWMDGWRDGWMDGWMDKER